MAGLAPLLQYLDRDDVTEVILQTGKAVTLRVGGQLRPIGAAVSAPQIEAILAEPVFADLHKAGQPERVLVDGRTMLTTVMRKGALVMVRLAKTQDAPAPDPRATPTYASAAVDPPLSSAVRTSPRMPAPIPGPPPPSTTTPTLRPGRAPIDIPPAETTTPTLQGLSSQGLSSIGGGFPPPDPAPLFGGGAREIELPPDDGGISIEPALHGGSPSATAVSPPPSFAPPPAFRPAPLAAPPAFRPAPVAAPPAVAMRPAAIPTAPSAPMVAHAEPAPTAAGPLSIEELLTIQPWSPGSFQPTFDPLMLQLFQAARQQAASDLHVTAGRPPQVRLVGQLQPLGEALDPARVESLLLPLLDERSAAQLQKLGYCDLAFEVPGAGRMRANVNRQKTGLKGCFRLILAEPPTLEQLGLPPELAKVTSYHQGLAIVSGPTGHGKTTTMAALVDLINSSKQSHIITVEDPVEIVHPKKLAVISQRQVGAHTNTFKAALKGALREDPDVIVIGELRDVETVEMALSAAETGHLVIATMSTPSGAKTIDRLIDMFPPEDQSQVRATLAGALKIIVSQRLVPRADGTSLVAAAELITGSFPLWNMIRDDKLYQLPSLVQRGRSFGMIRIEDSLRKLVEDKVITMEAATRFASDPRALLPPAAAAMPPGFKPKGVKEPAPAPTPAPEVKKPVRPPFKVT